jgi:hypothetical protein
VRGSTKPLRQELNHWGRKRCVSASRSFAINFRPFVFLSSYICLIALSDDAARSSYYCTTSKGRMNNKLKWYWKEVFLDYLWLRPTLAGGGIKKKTRMKVRHRSVGPKPAKNSETQKLLRLEPTNPGNHWHVEVNCTCMKIPKYERDIIDM